MDISTIKGMKYPDEYFIKFFFKNNFHNKQGLTFLELGCANGCNLTLPFQYNNNVIGVDFDKQHIEFANHNFKIFSNTQTYKFYHNDMRNFCDEQKDINADILVLPNSIYYVPQNDFLKLLNNIKSNGLIKSNIPFFIRFRELDDFRNHKGEKVCENGYIINNGITGEDGAFCKFYSTPEMIAILQNELNLRNFQTMKIKNENIQNNTTVNNSDVVIWGTIN